MFPRPPDWHDINTYAYTVLKYRKLYAITTLLNVVSASWHWLMRHINTVTHQYEHFRLEGVHQSVTGVPYFLKSGPLLSVTLNLIS